VLLRPLVFGLKAGKRKETKVEFHTIPLPSFTPAFFDEERQAHNSNSHTSDDPPYGECTSLKLSVDKFFKVWDRVYCYAPVFF
jgi:hypothetical protein